MTTTEEDHGARHWATITAGRIVIASGYCWCTNPVDGPHTLGSAAAPDHQAEAPSDAWSRAEKKYPSANASSPGAATIVGARQEGYVAGYTDALAARPVVDDAAVERALEARDQYVDRPDLSAWDNAQLQMRAALEAAALGGDQ